MLIPLRMLLEKPGRLVVTSLGLGVLFFLAAAQLGMLVGWCNTNSAIVRHAGVDVWVMAEQTPAFDYGTPIPRQRLYQARGIEGVEWAEPMFVCWNSWQRPDGRRVNIELIGLDRDCIGGPWRMKTGEIDDVHLPDSVIVDELYFPLLGVNRVGDEAEIYGRRAIVRGVSEDVRTFTASPFVFTSIRTAIRYDRRYRPNEITYVMVRGAPGHSPAEVAARLRNELPHVEVLTTDEFAERTVRYWMLETGVGITVVLTAALGVLVGVVVTSQTLYTLTQEHMATYATLLALGFARSKLVGYVVFQALALGSIGITLGSLAFFVAAQVSERTPVPLETTPTVYSGLIALALVCGAASAFLSVRAILRIDPVAAFKG